MKNTDFIIQSLAKLRDVNPLVHNITNVVVTNFTANGLLALGASPVMAYAKEEVAEMTKIAGALVLNIGTLDAKTVEAMIIAGKTANEHDVPVILDPVGAGATTYRTETARKILNEVHISVVRGNAGEIANVIGEKVEVKGVDAIGGDGDTAALAQKAALKLNTIVVITGKIDVISDGTTTHYTHNGHHLLTKVTGAGCLLTSVIGAFTAVENNRLKAAVSALVCYGVAAELAVKSIRGNEPGSFQIEFLNKLASIQKDDINAYASFE